jgi:hypothetical protein
MREPESAVSHKKWEPPNIHMHPDINFQVVEVDAFLEEE